MVLTAFVVALTRLLAVAQSLWDWDEVQFAMAVEEYDAASHRPHPPGFPFYMFLAKIARVISTSDFRALQIVTVAAAMALFPLLFFLFRELRFPFATAWSGALLTVFVPNVWFYGGTAFSDVTGLALTIAACAFLLRGIRDHSSFLLGAFLLGLAASIRPQALLIAAAPALLATWKRRGRWRDIFEAIALGATTIAIAYSGAILASSSWAEYAETARKLREYLRTVDSFLSPERAPLATVFEAFFMRAFPGGNYGRALVAGALAGAVITLIRREGRLGLLLLTFLPFQIFAWLMLDYHSVTRYGIAFVPPYGLLAAAGVIGFFAWIPGLGRLAGSVLVVLFTLLYARWPVPALTEVRQNLSPPVRAVQWVNEGVPASTIVYVDDNMVPFASYFMGGRQLAKVEVPADLGPVPPPADSVVLTELPSALARARRFVRPRGVLFDIVRHRYFDTTVIPAEAWAAFGEGWYDTEWYGSHVWIWMRERSSMLLPPARGPVTLAVRLEPVPGHAPVIEARVNGALIERFEVAKTTDRRWTVRSRADGWNELTLTSDRVTNPSKDGTGGDARDLSVRLLSYDWIPASP